MPTVRAVLLPMRPGLVCAVLVAAACASAPPARVTVATSLADADRRRLEGCYDCLLEARDRYREAAVGANRTRARLREFETELLLALREREFAIDTAPTLARARALSADLPPAIDAARAITLVEAVPHRGAGWSRREAAAFRAAHPLTPASVAEAAAWLRAGGLTPAVGEYLARSLECSVPDRGPSEPPRALQPPLLRYREATCRAVDAAALVDLREREARFVEVSYFIGELAVTAIAQPGSPNPHRLVNDARRRFPGSPMVVFLAARLQQTVGDCEGALVAFDDLLALAPSHEDGWLGRVMCQTDLLRHEDAVAAATHMIDRAFDNADDARFWRAWNLHLLADLPRARADIDEVRARRQNANILTLAGAIAHDQQQYDGAERDLRAAERMASGKGCRAYWYLGSVLVKTMRLAEALPAFESAMTCYGEEAATRERMLATVLADPAVDAEFRRVQSLRLREEARVHRHQQYASALNLASIHVARREPARAAPYLDIAAQDPALAADVNTLRAAMAQ